MRIILDFDFTIFDTEKLRGAVSDMFLEYGVDKGLFFRTFEESRGAGGDWNPEAQFEILGSLGIAKIKNIEVDFYEIIKNSREFLYEDTLPFLKRIKNKHSLALLTYGGNSFQGKKLAGCKNITRYFDKIIITKNLRKDKEASDLSFGKPAVFVEDNPSALLAAKKYAPHLTTVRINRGAGRYADEASGEGVDWEVKSLREVERIISN